MNKKNYTLLSAICIIGIILVFQANTLSYSIREKINNILIEAIDADLLHRMETANIQFRSGSFYMPEEEMPEGIRIITKAGPSFMPYNSSNNIRKTVLLDKKKVHQSAMYLLNPVNIQVFDSIFRSKTSKKSIKTSLHYRNDKNIATNSPSSLDFFSLHMHTKEIPLDIEEKLTIKATLLLSPIWIIKQMPSMMRCTSILFITLSLLFFKRNINWLTLARLGKTETEKLSPHKTPQTLSTDIAPVKTSQLVIETTIHKKIMPLCQSSKSLRKIGNGYFQVGNILLNTNDRILMDCTGKKIGLSNRKEYDLLYAFLEADNHFLSHTEVANILQLEKYSSESKRSCIWRLRGFLRTDPNILISSKRYHGYTLLLKQDSEKKEK